MDTSQRGGRLLLDAAVAGERGVPHGHQLERRFGKVRVPEDLQADPIVTRTAGERAVVTDAVHAEVVLRVRLRPEDVGLEVRETLLGRLDRNLVHLRLRPESHERIVLAVGHVAERGHQASRGHGDEHGDDRLGRVEPAVAVRVDLVIRPGRLDGAGVDCVALVVAVAELGVGVVGQVPIPILVGRRDLRRLRGDGHHVATTLTVALDRDRSCRVGDPLDRDLGPRRMREAERRGVAPLVHPVRALRRIGSDRRIRRDAVGHLRVLGGLDVDRHAGAEHRDVRGISPLDRGVVRERLREELDRVIPAGRRHIVDVQRRLLRPRRRAGRRGRGGGRRGRRSARRRGGRGGAGRRGRRRCRTSPAPRTGLGRGGRDRRAASPTLARVRRGGGRRTARTFGARGRGRSPSLATSRLVPADVVAVVPVAGLPTAVTRDRHGDRHRVGDDLEALRRVGAAEERDECSENSELDDSVHFLTFFPILT